MLRMLQCRTEYFQAFPYSDSQCMQHGCDMTPGFQQLLTADATHFKLVPYEAIASLSDTTSANGQNQPRTEGTAGQG